MYCPYCGAQLEKDQLFCHVCGESQQFEEESMIPAEPADSAPETEKERADAPSAEEHGPVSGEANALSLEEGDPRRADSEPEAPAAEPADRETTESEAVPAAEPFPETAEEASLSVVPSREKETPSRKASSAAPLRTNHGARSISRAGLVRMALCCVGTIAAVLLLTLLLNFVSAAGERRLAVVISDDLALFHGSQNSTMELNYLEDAITLRYGSKSSAAMMQLGSAALAGKNILVYLDDYIEKTQSWTLKRHDLRRPELELQIDNGVYSELLPGTCGQAGELSAEWKMSTDGGTIFYLKEMTASGASLYRYSGKESKLVDTGVALFDISPDGRKAVWVCRDEHGSDCLLRVQEFGKKSEALLLDTEFDQIAGYTEGMETVYYLRDNGDVVRPYSLFAAGLQTEKVRIIPGLSWISPVTEKGAFFFVAADDSSPENLYYHTSDGTEDRVTRSCSGVLFTDEERGIVIYRSETSYDRSYYLYAGGSSLDLGARRVLDAVVNKKGTELYFILQEEDGEQALYSCQFISGKPSEAERIASSCSEIVYDEAGDALFYAVYASGMRHHASLYRWDGKAAHLLSDDAFPMVVYSGKGSWAFFTETDVSQYGPDAPNLAMGTLNLYSGDNVLRVDGDVSLLFWHFEPDGAILYIRNYYDMYGGVLCLYRTGKEPDRLAVDVQAILPQKECQQAMGR